MLTPYCHIASDTHNMHGTRSNIHHKLCQMRTVYFVFTRSCAHTRTHIYAYLCWPKSAFQGIQRSPPSSALNVVPAHDHVVEMLAYHRLGPPVPGTHFEYPRRAGGEATGAETLKL